jgi:hypothetical protein
MTEHKNLAAALIAAQHAFGDVTKGKRVDVRSEKTGKTFSYTYADLGTVLDAVMPALHANGLTIVQAMNVGEGGVPGIVTKLLHADSDQSETSFTPIYWADRNDTQKYGGAITYCRRYAIMALLCLNAEDDDGQRARQPRQIPDNVNPVSGEIEEAIPVPSGPEVDKKKANLIRDIMVMAGKIGVGDEEVKEAMRAGYRPLETVETFSRKNLKVDELEEFKRKMKLRQDRVLAERGRA